MTDASATSEFGRRFEELMRRHHGRPSESVWTVVERWEHLVSACAKGYQWSMYELDNDVQVRDLLQAALDDPMLEAFPQMTDVRGRVAAADRRFRALLSTETIRGEASPWWSRALLAHAGEEYREDAARIHGFAVAPPEDPSTRDSDGRDREPAMTPRASGILCAFCGQDRLRSYVVRATGARFLLCPECESVWLPDEDPHELGTLDLDLLLGGAPPETHWGSSSPTASPTATFPDAETYPDA